MLSAPWLIHGIITAPPTSQGTPGKPDPGQLCLPPDLLLGFWDPGRREPTEAARTPSLPSPRPVGSHLM